MEFLLLGFFTGLSLILAIGAQNIFVIEQGLKKQHVFLVCIVCSISDLILIFLGIFIFQFFNQYFNSIVELLFNIALVIFLLHFIYSKIKNYNTAVNFDTDLTSITAFNIFLKTLGFTYLNPHVYSDTVFFLGNFSKNFIISQKILFGVGASIASFLFFFLIGYLSKYLSKYAKSKKIWNIINISIIIFMSFLTLFIITKMIN
ncbi:LysE/ArgO family amino acid transporter [Candidatus Pelagibacter bacterium nBUS_27]|uniref:LysE/ArgO family amino acid transporter n=1 Tax=Candidatus Pelagibacter bacterium nBUS_27 TaxID=3374188 RepID=UPI003EBC8ED8